MPRTVEYSDHFSGHLGGDVRSLQTARHAENMRVYTLRCERNTLTILWLRLTATSICEWRYYQIIVRCAQRDFILFIYFIYILIRFVHVCTTY